MEDIANRGSNESCLLRFCKLLKREKPEIEHLIIWSDQCGGQNKNFPFIRIRIEKALWKHQNIYTQDQYGQIIKYGTFFINDFMSTFSQASFVQKSGQLSEPKNEFSW